MGRNQHSALATRMSLAVDARGNVDPRIVQQTESKAIPTRVVLHRTTLHSSTIDASSPASYYSTIDASSPASDSSTIDASRPVSYSSPMVPSSPEPYSIGDHSYSMSYLTDENSLPSVEDGPIERPNSLSERCTILNYQTFINFVITTTTQAEILLAVYPVPRRICPPQANMCLARGQGIQGGALSRIVRNVLTLMIR